jgi:methionyl-tRNA formyltransferase
VPPSRTSRSVATRKLTASPIKQLAVKHHVPVFQPTKIRDPQALDQSPFLRPDFIVVIAYGQILPGALIRIPTIAA